MYWLETKNVSFPHIFAKFCRVYCFYNSLKGDRPRSSNLYGITWDASKQNSSPHPTKLARTRLYSHMSSIKACSSRLNQVLIDILYSRYVHSILLSHSFYTNLAQRENFPVIQNATYYIYKHTHFAPLLYTCFPFYFLFLFVEQATPKEVDPKS